jgi:hypothetical protein
MLKGFNLYSPTGGVFANRVWLSAGRYRRDGGPLGKAEEARWIVGEEGFAIRGIGEPARYTRTNGQSEPQTQLASVKASTAAAMNGSTSG